MRLLFDLETNGLMARPDLRVHCGAAIDLDTGEEFVARPDDLPAFVALLSRADELVGHNVAGFDIPVMERCLGFVLRPGVRLYDTLLASRARYISDMLDRTARFRNSAGRSEKDREALFPRRFMNPRGLHGLKSWGYRLGEYKGDFLEKLSGAAEGFSEELLQYCLQDVRVNVKLWHRLQQPDRQPARPAPSYESMIVESQVGYILEQQTRHGVGFNKEAAEALWASLAGKRDALGRELREKYFPDWIGPALARGDHDPALPHKSGDWAYKIPTRTYKVQYPHNLAGRTKGCPFTPVEVKEFNPGSRQQIGERLQKLYGWRPTAFTDSGLPEVSEETMADLDLPPVPLLMEYLLVDRLIGQLAEGPQSWVKTIGDDGHIHGTVLPTGARTGRGSHSRPNTGNVPKVKKHAKTKEVLWGHAGGYGADCRALFRPTRTDMVMVGVDASGLQLRCLASRLGVWDGGAYAKVLLEGDPHESWRLVTGLFSRDNQKTLGYAFLFGARDPKLGSIVLADWREAFMTGGTTRRPPPASAVRELGEASRNALLTRVPGLEELMDACETAHKSGFVIGLDGRTVATKALHGVLNDVLQGDEAVVMKHTMIGFREAARREGLVTGRDYAQMLFVHDELQLEAAPSCADTVGALVVQSIRDAGVKLGFRCQLDGQAKVGKTWQETH